MTRNEDRILRVIAHIHDRPGGDLSIDALADVAAMSRFHFHRFFRAVTGETCAHAVKRLRTHRAAALLVQTDVPVAEIGARVAYPNPTSFSRAFSSVFTHGPNAFRALGRLPVDRTLVSRGDTIMHDVDIRQVPERRLAAIAHQGAYPEIARAFQSLFAIIGARQMFGQIGHGIAIYDYLYGTWLAQSDQIPGEQPSYEVYLNDPTQVAPEELLTEVHIPLADEHRVE